MPLTELAGPTMLLANATMADRSHPIRVEAVRVPPPLTPVVPVPPTTPPGTHVTLYGSTLPDRTSQAMKRPHHVPLLLMHPIRLTPLGEGPPALSDVT